MQTSLRPSCMRQGFSCTHRSDLVSVSAHKVSVTSSHIARFVRVAEGVCAVQRTARRTRCPLVVTNAKGFGDVKQQKQKPARPEDGCACGSGKYYKQCCKPYHKDELSAPTPEGTVRARFSATLRKDIPYLVKTTHPEYHTVAYDCEPGTTAPDRLVKDLEFTCKNFELTNFKFFKVEDGDSPNEKWVISQYSSHNFNQPEKNADGSIKRLIRVERCKFIVGDDKVWRLADYALRELPEGLLLDKQAEANRLAERAREETAAEPAATSANS